MSRFFGYFHDQVRRGKPDGEWDWDSPLLRSVYQSAERPYVENGSWYPMGKESHLAVWDSYKRHLLRLKPGEGDAVEKHQPYIDTLLLMEAQFAAAASMPLEGYNAREEIDRMFSEVPEHLSAMLFGRPIEDADVHAVSYRKMVRLGLMFISSAEIIPSTVEGAGPEDLKQPYSTFTNLLNEGIYGIGEGRDFGEAAHKAVHVVQEARAFFIVANKMAEADFFPLDEPPSNV